MTGPQANLRPQLLNLARHFSGTVTGWISRARRIDLLLIAAVVAGTVAAYWLADVGAAARAWLLLLALFILCLLAGSTITWLLKLAQLKRRQYTAVKLARDLGFTYLAFLLSWQLSGIAIGLALAATLSALTGGLAVTAFLATFPLTLVALSIATLPSQARLFPAGVAALVPPRLLLEAADSRVRGWIIRIAASPRARIRAALHQTHASNDAAAALELSHSHLSDSALLPSTASIEGLNLGAEARIRLRAAWQLCWFAVFGAVVAMILAAAMPPGFFPRIQPPTQFEWLVPPEVEQDAPVEDESPQEQEPESEDDPETDAEPQDDEGPEGDADGGQDEQSDDAESGGGDSGDPDDDSGDDTGTGSDAGDESEPEEDAGDGGGPDGETDDGTGSEEDAGEGDGSGEAGDNDGSEDESSQANEDSAGDSSSESDSASGSEDAGEPEGSGEDGSEGESAGGDGQPDETGPDEPSASEGEGAGEGESGQDSDGPGEAESQDGEQGEGDQQAEAEQHDSDDAGQTQASPGTDESQEEAAGGEGGQVGQEAGTTEPADGAADPIDAAQQSVQSGAAEVGELGDGQQIDTSDTMHLATAELTGTENPDPDGAVATADVATADEVAESLEMRMLRAQTEQVELAPDGEEIELGAIRQLFGEAGETRSVLQGEEYLPREFQEHTWQLDAPGQLLPAWIERLMH